MQIGAGRIGHAPGGGPIARDVAATIDHTLLKPEATAAQIEQLCKEAAEFGFASVCINPSWVRLAARLLKGSSVAVCTVAGFPLGAHVAEVKALEARRAIREGAGEIDMVINIGALKSGDDETVYRDIRAVVEACEDGRALCKVIIECALLSDDEKVRACRLSRKARADFVKTSTGFASGGATAADVALMSEVVRGSGMGVKAAGGIRSYVDLRSMVQAGATRIGASAGVQIVKEAKGTAPPAAASTAGKNEKY
jgi:deoxyribose-phosphate aldolase